MSTVGISLVVPATDGVGPASETANMQKRKTIVVEEATGVFSGVVIVEATAAAGGWCQIESFAQPGSREVDIVCDQLRVRRLGAGSGTPTVDVSAEEGIVRTASLAVPAGAGPGASTDVTAFGEDYSVFVSSPFGGAIEVEGSADDVDFAQVFRSFVGPGCQTKKVPANFLRVRRRGAAISGAPAVTVAAVSELQSLGAGEIDGWQVQSASLSTVNIAAGTGRDSTNSTIMTSTGVLVADITASGANGLDTGSEASSTWYALFVIDGPGVPIASLFSVSATAPTLPAGYTVFRRVGWVFNNASSNLNDVRYEGRGKRREVFINTSFANRQVLSAGAATTWTDVDCSDECPPTCRLSQFFAEQNTLGGPDLQVREKGFGNAANGQVEVPGGVAAGSQPRMAFYLGLDASQVFQYQNTAAGGTSDIYQISYIDDL